MSRVKVTLLHEETAEFDTGDLPVTLIRELLKKNDGTFDGNWGLGDVSRKADFKPMMDTLVVEEVE